MNAQSFENYILFQTNGFLQFIMARFVDFCHSRDDRLPHDGISAVLPLVFDMVHIIATQLSLGYVAICSHVYLVSISTKIFYSPPFLVMQLIVLLLLWRNPTL